MRDVIHQWRANENVAWKLPLLEQVLAGPFTGKQSTPYGARRRARLHAREGDGRATTRSSSARSTSRGAARRTPRTCSRSRTRRSPTSCAAFVDAVRARYGPVATGRVGDSDSRRRCRVARMRFQGKTALVTGEPRHRRRHCEAVRRRGRDGRRRRLRPRPRQTRPPQRSAVSPSPATSPRAPTSRRAVATAVEHGGSLDLLVTCAGIIRDNLLHKMATTTGTPSSTRT